MPGSQRDVSPLLVLLPGEAEAVGHGAATAPRGAVMTAAYFRAHIPAAWREEYVAKLGDAQARALATSRDIRPAR